MQKSASCLKIKPPGVVGLKKKTNIPNINCGIILIAPPPKKYLPRSKSWSTETQLKVEHPKQSIRKKKNSYLWPGKLGFLWAHAFVMCLLWLSSGASWSTLAIHGCLGPIEAFQGDLRPPRTQRRLHHLGLSWPKKIPGELHTKRAPSL